MQVKIRPGQTIVSWPNDDDDDDDDDKDDDKAGDKEDDKHDDKDDDKEINMSQDQARQLCPDL